MELRDLIKFLEARDPAKVVPLGFSEPHSYRGDYYDLAFEPTADVTVGSMLECARFALGQTFQGYKGGDFTMREYTSVHLAHYGMCGEGIGPHFLKYMVGEYPSPPN